MGIDWLVEPTLALTAALALVLALRPLLRRMFGAGAAHGLWAIVPAALAAVMLPAAAEPVLPALADVVAVDPVRLDVVASAPAATGPSVLAWLWAAGVLVAVALQWWQQRRFMAGLGPLSRRPDGHHQALATRGLPAVVGLRPRIVLPRDFEQRYAPHERELVLAHELAHLRRGDLASCAVVAVLRTLFWFHPLVHFAVPRFRQDQELACDAVVLRRFPTRRREYGDVMLKTELADQPLPLGCHWSGSHPLKERLAMLKHPLPTPRRRFAGFALASLLGLAAAAVAWAAQPGAGEELPAGKLRLAIQAKVDGQPVEAHQAVLGPGLVHRWTFRHADQAWDTSWTVTPLEDGTFDLKSRLLRDGEVVGEPRMIVRDQAAIGIGQQGPEGSFTGIEIELSVEMGPPAPGMAAVGIAGPAPDYPKAAADAGQGGTVMLKVLVGTDGAAREVQFVADKSTVAADSELARNSVDAALKWTFEPRREDGKPVEAWVMVPVRFEPPAAAPEA